MIQIKKFYSLKGGNNSWHPLSQENGNPPKAQNDFQLIEIVLKLVTLYGLFFPTKVPPFILVDNLYYFLTIKYTIDKKVIVGYASNQGDFYKSFEADKEKKAKKALASFLKSQGIV